MTILLLLASVAYADLGDFPDSFIKAKKFNGYIVVGIEGSSSDVIGQSLVGLAISSYLNSPQEGIYKLDDEVDLDSNLILVGSPCVNGLTNELLRNPEPCDSDFPEGKAYIRYYENEGVQYIVVAGYSDQGTRKAAERLADFFQDPLDGKEAEIDVGGTETKLEKKTKTEEKAQEKTQETQDAEKTVQETQETQEGQTSDSSDSDKPTIVAEAKYDNIFMKFWKWLKGLFA